MSIDRTHPALLDDVHAGREHQRAHDRHEYGRHGCHPSPMGLKPNATLEHHEEKEVAEHHPNQKREEVGIRLQIDVEGKQKPDELGEMLAHPEANPVPEGREGGPLCRQILDGRGGQVGRVPEDVHRGPVLHPELIES